jgi:hemerythrin superfamily protein
LADGLAEDATDCVVRELVAQYVAGQGWERSLPTTPFVDLILRPAMNAVISKLPTRMTTATHMIRMDHGAVMAKFHRIDAATQLAQKKALVEVICLALEIHAQLEEELFYPALQEAGASAEVLGKSVPEHDAMRGHIERLRSMQPEDAAYDQELMSLMRDVIHHVADEETVLLPEAEQLLGERNQEIGMQMTKRRLQLMAPHGGEMLMNAAKALPNSTLVMIAGGLLAGGFMVRRAMMTYRYAR